MNNCLSSLFLICISVAFSITTMVCGWGLQPKSWGVIICVGLIGQWVVSGLTQASLGKWGSK